MLFFKMALVSTQGNYTKIFLLNVTQVWESVTIYKVVQI